MMLFMLALCLHAMAQNGIITGTVVEIHLIVCTEGKERSAIYFCGL